jgi:hypothetical protein
MIANAMMKYQYSINRFVPYPVRGKFLNLGLIIRSDQTGEWLSEGVSSMSRASRLDDDKVFSILATDLSQLQSTIESYTEPEFFERTVVYSIKTSFCIFRRQADVKPAVVKAIWPARPRRGFCHRIADYRSRKGRQSDQAR